MSELEAFNRSLFLQINCSDGNPVWLAWTAIFIADGLIYLLPLLLAGLWFWGDHARRNLATRACLVALLSLAFNQVIYAFWPHPRPFMIGLGHTWIPHAADSSFPSDHMTVFCGVGFSLLFGGELAWGLVTLLAALAVAWARIFLGVHFPLDMAGAVIVTAVMCAIIAPIWRKIGSSITDSCERLYRRLLAKPIALGWVRA